MPYCTAGIGFFFNGVLYPNNSVILLADIGREQDVVQGDSTALFCLTDLLPCCRAADGGTAGEWYLAGQTRPVTDAEAASGSESFTRIRAPSAVLLLQMRNDAGPGGIFTCQIPDGSGQLRTAYIGVNTGIIN